MTLPAFQPNGAGGCGPFSSRRGTYVRPVHPCRCACTTCQSERVPVVKKTTAATRIPIFRRDDADMLLLHCPTDAAGASYRMPRDFALLGEKSAWQSYPAS